MQTQNQHIIRMAQLWIVVPNLRKQHAIQEDGTGKGNPSMSAARIAISPGTALLLTKRYVAAPPAAAPNAELMIKRLRSEIRAHR